MELLDAPQDAFVWLAQFVRQKIERVLPDSARLIFVAG
jgi:hypothetical protein